MKRLLMWPLALPLLGVVYLGLSVCESWMASVRHPVSPIGEDNFAFISSGLGAIFISPLFLVWDLLRNKRRDIALEDAFRLLAHHQLWPLLFLTLMLFFYLAIPTGLWRALDAWLAGATRGVVSSVMFDQATLPFSFNAFAAWWGLKRFILRRSVLTPHVLGKETAQLWNKFKATWTMTPSRTQPPI